MTHSLASKLRAYSHLFASCDV